MIQDIYYLDDFKVTVKLCAPEGVTESIENLDFDIYLSSGSNNFIAGRHGDEWYNCKAHKGNSLIIICNNHGLKPCSRLGAEVVYYIPDEDMPDGNRRVTYRCRTNIQLTSVPMSNRVVEGEMEAYLPAQSAVSAKKQKRSTVNSLYGSGRIIHRGIMPVNAETGVYYNSDGYFALSKRVSAGLCNGKSQIVKIPAFLRKCKFEVCSSLGGYRLEYEWVDEESIKILPYSTRPDNVRVVIRVDNYPGLSLRSGKIMWLDKSGNLREDYKGFADRYPEPGINPDVLRDLINGHHKTGGTDGRCGKLLVYKRSHPSRCLDSPISEIMMEETGYDKESMREYRSRVKRWYKTAIIRNGIYKIIYQTGRKRYRSKTITVSIHNGKIKVLGLG